MQTRDHHSADEDAHLAPAVIAVPTASANRSCTARAACAPAHTCQELSPATIPLKRRKLHANFVASRSPPIPWPMNSGVRWAASPRIKMLPGPHSSQPVRGKCTRRRVRARAVLAQPLPPRLYQRVERRRSAVVVGHLVREESELPPVAGIADPHIGGRSMGSRPGGRSPLISSRYVATSTTSERCWNSSPPCKRRSLRGPGCSPRRSQAHISSPHGAPRR